MDKTTKIKYYINSLCIYDLQDDELFRSMLSLLNSSGDALLRAYSKFYKQILKSGSLKEHISKCILTNDNIFTKAACSGKANDEITKAAQTDLEMLEKIAELTAEDIINSVSDKNIKEILMSLPKFKSGEPLSPLKNNWSGQIDELIEYHKTNGYGKFAKKTRKRFVKM